MRVPALNTQTCKHKIQCWSFTPKPVLVRTTAGSSLTRYNKGVSESGFSISYWNRRLLPNLLSCQRLSQRGRSREPLLNNDDKLSSCCTLELWLDKYKDRRDKEKNMSSLCSVLTNVDDAPLCGDGSELPCWHQHVKRLFIVSSNSLVNLIIANWYLHIFHRHVNISKVKLWIMHGSVTQSCRN